MFNVKKRLLVLGLAAMSGVAVMSTSLATPVQARGISGWHCNDYNEWTYVNAWFDNVTGWQQIGGSWYYFRGDGVMEDGWRYIGGSWYFLGNDGAMRTGWVKDDGDWYYLNSSGQMCTGWHKIGGSWYYLFGSGRMASDCYIDNYHLNSSGAWDY